MFQSLIVKGSFWTLSAKTYIVLREYSRSKLFYKSQILEKVFLIMNQLKDFFGYNSN